MVPCDADSAKAHLEAAIGNADAPLGARMHSCGLVLRGTLPELRWLELLHAVARAIGMNAIGEPKIWNYPFEGKGGTGQTVLLPITESFLALDTWSDHDGAYLFVCSCRSYDIAAIDAVAHAYGLKTTSKVGARFYSELRLT